MTLPTLPVAGSLAEALAPATLRALGGHDLARFLAAQRWFGGKGRAPATVRIAEVIPVAWDGDAAAVARLVVEAEGAPAASYQLPLVAREGEPHRPQAVLALVDAAGVRGALVDALGDAAFRARLGAALARGASFEGEGARWELAPVDGGAGDLAALPSRPIDGEQSNTSVVYGDRAILKLFRRLEPGENPDVEITRFLTTRTPFRHTPELLGTITFRTADGEACAAGMLSRFLPGVVDGWTYVLQRLEPYLRAPAAPEPPVPLIGEARRLGAVTRELHDALASDPSAPGFAVEPVTRGDADRWIEAARNALDASLDLLAARQGALDARTLPMARAIAGRRAGLHARLDDVAAAVRDGAFAGRKTRHHGDYHLGQTLRTPDGDWMVIDFEGEPARALATRRAPSSPLRDVAGMLRSFAYAAATAAARAGGLGVNPTVEVRAARWERDTRAAFLAAYGAPPHDSLIALFEIEKLFYELEYELNNRPDWAWIPLRGIAKLF